MRNEGLLLPDLCRSLGDLTSDIQRLGYEVEVIFMDNSSNDETKPYLQNFVRDNTSTVAYRYVRNQRDIGLQASLMTSMEIAQGDAYVVLHSDLEDPPELILKFISEWESGYKTVVGVMETRSDPKMYQLTSKLFYRILKLTSDQHVLADFTDFFLIDKSVYKDISLRPRTNQYIRGIISANYGVDSRISYNRRRRKAGNSNFNFAKRYEVALDAIFAIGTKIPRSLSLLTFVFSLLSIIPYFLIPIQSELRIHFEVSKILMLNLICLGLTIMAACFEILFRIYNFLINTNKSYLYEEFNPKSDDGSS